MIKKRYLDQNKTAQMRKVKDRIKKIVIPN